MADSETIGCSSLVTGRIMIKANGEKSAKAQVNWASSEAEVPVVNDSRACVILVPDLKDPKGGEIGQTEVNDPEEKESEGQESQEKQWNDLTPGGKARKVLLTWIAKPLVVLGLLFLFVCSLDLLSSAFRLVGGKAAGNAFSSSVLVQNPVAGLMVGILSTVLVQSSSTSTSIVVAMVSSGILPVRPAIPIIMGANIGTSVTNTIVSLAQSTDRGQFERAFAGATVHDMFNWLAVIVLLPIEIASGYLYHSTSFLVEKGNFQTVEGGNKDILKAITKPVTNLVVQLDKNVIKELAMSNQEYQNHSLLKHWCDYESVLVPVADNLTMETWENSTLHYNVLVNGTAFIIKKEPVESCQYLLRYIPLNDTFLGLILMGLSLLTLCVCLVLIVKTLNSVLKGPVSKAAHKVINKDLPGKCAYFTGYLAILAGAGLTIMVQSSSVFTSTLTPLVGMNIIGLERMYPLTLGSNIGTTTTGLLAAMAASGDKQQAALQIALVHLLFNISGILLFFPIPAMRFPIPLAELMGRTTAKYRWFAVFYLVAMFFLLPGCLFGLSLAGTLVFTIVGSIAAAFLLFLVAVNVLKKKFGSRIPRGLRRFLDCLPRPFYSLAPLDNVFRAVGGAIKRLFCRCCPKDEKSESLGSSEPMLNQSDSSTSSSSSSGVGTIRKNASFLDRMTDEQLRDYESTVRSLEEVKVMLTVVDKEAVAAETESGYATMISTPYISKYPSREDFSDL